MFYIKSPYSPLDSSKVSNTVEDTRSWTRLCFALRKILRILPHRYYFRFAIAIRQYELFNEEVLNPGASK